MRYPICLAFALFLTVSLLPAAAPQITADENAYDAATQSLVFSGDAVLVHDDYTIEADIIRFFRAEGRAEASGNVRVTQKGGRMVTDRLTYWVEERRFAAERFRMASPPFFVEGESMAGSRSEVVFSRPAIFLHEPVPLAPKMEAETATLVPGESLRTTRTRLGPAGLGGIRVDRLERDLQAPWLQFTGDAGYRSSLGAYLRTDTLWPVSPALSLGGALDVYTQRGILFGPDFNLRLDPGDWTHRTEFRSGYINDRGDPDLDALFQPVGDDRWFASLRHRSREGDRFWLNSSLDVWSDSEVLRDFRPRRYARTQQPDNHTEVVGIWNNTYFSALVRTDWNDFQYLVERLPELRLDHVSTPIGQTGIYQSFSASMARLRLRTNLVGWEVPGQGGVWPDGSGGYAVIDGAPSLPAQAAFWAHAAMPPGALALAYPIRAESNRVDLWYQLRRPTRLAPWLNLNPLAAVRLTHFEDRSTQIGVREDYSRWMGSFGFDLEATAHATWERRNSLWGIDGLRHLLKPVVQYRWMPGSDRGGALAWAFDPPAYSPLAPALEIDQIRPHFADSEIHLLRFSLLQWLQTRRADYGSHDLVEFALHQDLDFTETVRPWRFTYASLAVKPAPWLRLAWEAQVQTERLTLEANRFSLSLIDADIWQARFFADYHRAGSAAYWGVEAYGLEIRRRLTDDFALAASWRWDSELSLMTEQRYSLRHRLSRDWELEYRLYFTRNDRRGDNVGFSLGIRLLAF